MVFHGDPAPQKLNLGKTLRLSGGRMDRVGFVGGHGGKNKTKGTKFWLLRHSRGRVRLRSAGAVAAVLEDALLEEGTELADIVFSEVGVAVGSERRAGGRDHHPEQVPQVALRQNNTMKDRQLTARPEDGFGF